jgi:hypothetical protein
MCLTTLVNASVIYSVGVARGQHCDRASHLIQNQNCPGQLSISAQSPHIHHRPFAPSLLGIPKLDAFNPAPVAGEIYDSSPATLLNSLSNRERNVLSVREMNYHSLKIDCSAFDTELERAVSLAIVHHDSIVVIPAVHIALPEIFPAGIIGATWNEA